MARNAKSLQLKSRTHQVFLDNPRVNRYRVISGGSGREYIVNIFSDGTAGCNCDWAVKRAEVISEQHGTSACSHTIAVFEFRAQGNGYRVSAWSSPEDVRRQHRHSRDIGDGLLLTARRIPRRYVQSDFFVVVDRAARV